MLQVLTSHPASAPLPESLSGKRRFEEMDQGTHAFAAVGPSSRTLANGAGAAFMAHGGNPSGGTPRNVHFDLLGQHTPGSAPLAKRPATGGASLQALKENEEPNWLQLGN